MNALFRSQINGVSAVFDVRKKIYDLLLALDESACQAALLSGQLSTYLKQWGLTQPGVELECDLWEQDRLRLVLSLVAKQDIDDEFKRAELVLVDWQVENRRQALCLIYSTPSVGLDEQTRCLIQQIAGRKSRERLLLDLEQQNQKLAEALEQSQVAIQAKAEFLANISHELRTPMNAVIGYSELLAKTELATQQRKFVQRVTSSAEHLMQIINDLLDFSRIDAGKLTIDFIPFSLNEQFEYVYTLFKRSFADKQIRLIFAIDGDVPNQLVGDPLRVNQILINFLSNALKFTDTGTVCLKVRQVGHQEDGCQILFAVRDEGIGVSPNKQDLIFESFTQADNSTTRNYGGSGLGLSICKKLAELLSADIGVESDVGKGATFWLSCGFSIQLESDVYQERLKSLQQGDYHAVVVEDNPELHPVWRSYFSKLQIKGRIFLMASEASTFLESTPTPMVNFMLCSRENPDREALLTVWKTSVGDDGIWVDMVTDAGSDDAQALRGQGSGYRVLSMPLLLDNVLHVLTDEDEIRTFETAEGVCEHSESLPDFNGLQILIVDDNELNREFLQQLLSEYQIICDMAENGAVAVNQVTEKKYDLIFMDLNMPILDGMSATQKIREQYTQDQLPVVVLTANVSRQDRERCLAAGVNDVLIKPIHNDQLIAALALGVKNRVNQPEKVELSAVVDSAVELSDQDKIQRLMQVSGLNVQKGLQVMGSSERRYLFILEKFVLLKSSIKEEVMLALKTKCREEAVRQVHSLKGSARVIYAEEITELAERLEFILKETDDYESVYPLIDNLEDQLQTLIAAISERLFTK